METVERIVCKDCGTAFVFTSGEQYFYKKQGWARPIRCKACRERKKRLREKEQKYEGLFEAMRNTGFKKRDTKGTVVNRSGSQWEHIDACYLMPDELPFLDCIEETDWIEEIVDF